VFISTFVILCLRHAGQGRSPKLLYIRVYARCDRRLVWVAKVKISTLRVTGDRWKRQLMVNRLYPFFKPYVGLNAHSRSSSIREKASRNHLASPVAAVVPT